MASYHKARLAAFLLLAALCDVSGRQQYRSRFPNGDWVPCPPDHGCSGELCVGVGHMSCLGGVVEPERNPFGQDFGDEGLVWTLDLCEADSDGDGFTNGEELGDPCCVWHQGAKVPEWMKPREWEVTHPGFASSVPSEHANLTELCEGIVLLPPDTFFNEGETEVTIEYVINEHVLKPWPTVYDYVRFNFPDDQKYHLVGIEPLVDNKEMVHHFVMYVCNEPTSTPGEILAERANTNSACEESIYLWGPGNGNFSAPLNVGIPVGNGTGHLGFELQIHYDNPLEQTGKTDASGVRVHFTTDLRGDEAGLLWSGMVTQVGEIPPKEEVVYSATICQLAIDEDQAPDGITVFSNVPHMHYLGKRLWTDILRVPSEDSGTNGSIVTDLTQLVKVAELSRDDNFDFNVQRWSSTAAVNLRNGDILATTCVYNSTERNESTFGGEGTFDEMCIDFIYFYPGAAMDTRLFCFGPQYIGTSLPDSATDFLDVVKASGVGTEIPKWRQAYLSGDLPCVPTNYSTIDLRSSDTSPDFGIATSQACTEGECSRECAEVMYNFMGCALLNDAVMKDGKKMVLFPSSLEDHVEGDCGQHFQAIYEENKVTPEGNGK